MLHRAPLLDPSVGEGSSTFRENVLKEVLHDDEASRPAASFRHHAMAHKRITKAVTAVVFCLVLILMLPTLCRSLSGKVTVAGSGSRRLAEGGKWSVSEDEELNAILDQCLDMEEEFARSGDGFFQQPEEKPDVAVGSTSLLPWMHGDAPSNDFNRQELRATTLQVPVGSWSLAHDEQLRDSASHLTHAGGGEDRVSSIAALTVGATSPLSGDGTPATSASPNLSPHSWLDQIPNVTLMDEESGWVVQPVRLEDVFGVFPDSNAASREPRSQGSPTNEPFLGQAGAKGEERLGGELVPAGLEGSDKAVEQPSTSVAASTGPGAKSHLDGNKSYPENHPFIRLPQVPLVSVSGPFDPIRGRPVLASHASTDMLLTIRFLFSKASLTAQDVELLAASIRSLVRFSCFRLGRHVVAKKQCHLIRHLGLSFLILDAVVCGLTLLGVDMVSAGWWVEFTSSFPTDYSLSKPWRDSSRGAKHNYKLGKHLLAALEMYKTGVRPRKEEVLLLKRMLLCSPYAVSHFKASRWNIWRQDDLDFRATHESQQFSADSETDGEED